MDKLKNWNAWFNDKIILHSSETGKPVVLSPNAVLGLEGNEDYTAVAMVDGIYFEVKEDVETIAGIIGECVDESEARKKAFEEKQRAQYAEMMKQQEATKESSEG